MQTELLVGLGGEGEGSGGNGGGAIGGGGHGGGKFGGGAEGGSWRTAMVALDSVSSIVHPNDEERELTSAMLLEASCASARVGKKMRARMRTLAASTSTWTWVASTFR